MREHSSTQVTVAATEVRNNFSSLLKRVYTGQEHLLVEKGGIPVAALIGIREYETFRQWLAQEIARSLGPAMADKAKDLEFDEARLVEALKEDRADTYREKYGE